MQEINHWLSKISIGKGTLEDFKVEYDRINAGTEQFATASQLFVRQITLGQVSSPEVINNFMLFEYIIYYKVNPAALKTLNKQTGEVEVLMTEKEGQQMEQQEEVIV